MRMKRKRKKSEYKLVEMDTLHALDQRAYEYLLL
jgi:hypothetical protein